MTTEELEALGANFYFIEIWIQPLEYNYDARRVSYITVKENLFNKKHTKMTKPLIQRKKVQKLMTEIGSGW